MTISHQWSIRHPSMVHWNWPLLDLCLTMAGICNYWPGPAGMRAMSITHHQYMVLAAAAEDAGPEERGIQAESGDDQEVVK